MAQPTPQFQFALLASLLRLTYAGPSIRSLFVLPRRWAEVLAAYIPSLFIYICLSYHRPGEDPRRPLGLRWRVTRRRKKGAADPAVPVRTARLAVEINVRRATKQVVARTAETTGHTGAAGVVVLAIA